MRIALLTAKIQRSVEQRAAHAQTAHFRLQKEASQLRRAVLRMRNGNAARRVAIAFQDQYAVLLRVKFPYKIQYALRKVLFPDFRCKLPL